MTHQETFLNHIASGFRIEGKILNIKKIGSGHIHDSYMVTTSPDESTDYVLQRINHHIFGNVDALTENILRVTSHVKNRLERSSAAGDPFRVIQLIHTHRGSYYLVDHEGNYWRMYDHVRASCSYDRLVSEASAYQAGKAFGRFQALTSDLDAGSLTEILPDFHHIGKRLVNFRKAVEANRVGRVASVKKEIEFAELRSDAMQTILRLGEAGEIPLRVTHNDTKCNNVLFNHDGEAISVIDLDTVMPGYVLYDFGDAIRTGASTAEEDEADLAKVGIDLALFKAYSRGYLDAASGFLTRTERDHLALSAQLMTYIIGLRFLTDYIDGDRYYKTSSEHHNLRRARAQFKLLTGMEEHAAEMESIIREAAGV